MKTVSYVPIYQWGDDLNSTCGIHSGTVMFLSVHDLFMFEPDAVGYYEVFGVIPTQKEYEDSVKLESDHYLLLKRD